MLGHRQTGNDENVQMIRETKGVAVSFKCEKRSDQRRAQADKRGNGLDRHTDKQRCYRMVSLIL